MTSELGKVAPLDLLYTDLKEDPLSVCQTLRAAYWTEMLVLVPGAVIPSCRSSNKSIFFPSSSAMS